MICHNTSNLPILLARSHTHTLEFSLYFGYIPFVWKSMMKNDDEDLVGY